MTEPTECQCPLAGYCKTLKRSFDPPKGRKMSETRHDECKNKPHYFEMFYSESENGSNPAQRTPSIKETSYLDTPCYYLGEVKRTVQCKPCSGKKQADVFHCEIHGECSRTHGIRSEGMKGKILKSCQHCDDYKPLEPEE